MRLTFTIVVELAEEVRSLDLIPLSNEVESAVNTAVEDCTGEEPEDIIVRVTIGDSH
jgi:hypothetical protein